MFLTASLILNVYCFSLFLGLNQTTTQKSNVCRCFPGRNKLYFECPAGTAAVATTAAARTTAASVCTRSIRSFGKLSTDAAAESGVTTAEENTTTPTTAANGHHTRSIRSFDKLSTDATAESNIATAAAGS